MTFCRNDSIEEEKIYTKGNLEIETSSDDTSADPKSVWEMFIIVGNLSVGPVVSMIFYMLVQILNTYFIGHTNDSSLIAGVGMGNMLINVLAFATT